jgi:beta-mannanase
MTVVIDNGPALLWGFFDPADWQRSLNGVPAYAAIDALLGTPMSMTAPQLSWANGTNADGSPVYQRLYTPRLDADRATGRVSLLSWASFNLANQQDLAFNLQSILTGKHDAYLDQFGADVAAWAHPLIVRLNWEMNGWWFPTWNEYDSNGRVANGHHAGDYARAWRYVVDRVRKAGATNIAWHWCPNVVAPKSGGPTAPGMLASFYPGDDYVDYVGCDLYNWAAAKNAPWMSLQQLLEGYAGWYGNTAAALFGVAPGKPWLIGELACNATGGDKAAWIKDTLTTLPKRYPMVRGLIWFNWGGDATWPITQPPEAATAFGAAVTGNPAYLRAGGFAFGPDGQPVRPYSQVTVPADPQVAALQAQIQTLQAQAQQASADAAAKQAAMQGQIDTAVAANAALRAKVDGLKMAWDALTHI